jgi:hypothetical protein
MEKGEHAGEQAVAVLLLSVFLDSFHQRPSGGRRVSTVVVFAFACWANNQYFN